MIRTQIYLTKDEHQGVTQLAKASGKKQSEVIREAIDEFLGKIGPQDKLSRVRKAKGIWKNRKDLDLRSIREGFDRF
ncbi:MAG: ribbon-helix-helix domain-containing protein [Verrucomicrobia bacterium]|nr:ribbon-helix-helix domain-containing protein [Verrucomicrobiota bacterium]MDA1065065.1 ribbon-helix-helix domain-containing protein [Verrucomicrobiota bacterium]